MCVSEPGAAEGFAVEVIPCGGAAAILLCINVCHHQGCQRNRTLLIHNIVVTKDENEIEPYSSTVNYRGVLATKECGMCQTGFMRMTVLMNI